jgi:hypothetical protein
MTIPDDIPMVYVELRCNTESCLNFWRTLDELKIPQPRMYIPDGPTRMTCGPCGVDITDIRPVN